MSVNDTTDGTRKVCDLDHLMVTLRRNKAAALRLVQLFLDNYPRHMQRLDVSSRDADLFALRDTVHDIRSSCMLFSAEITVDVARDLEYALHEYQLHGIEADWVGKATALRNAMAVLAARLCNFVDENAV